MQSKLLLRKKWNYLVLLEKHKKIFCVCENRWNGNSGYVKYSGFSFLVLDYTKVFGRSTSMEKISLKVTNVTSKMTNAIL